MRILAAIQVARFVFCRAKSTISGIRCKMEELTINDLARRLDQVQSHLAIQQLAVRYALAVDSRDIDSWLELFLPDVDCGRFGKGRRALRMSIEPALRSFYRSIHLVCGHVIEFDGPSHFRMAKLPPQVKVNMYPRLA